MMTRKDYVITAEILNRFLHSNNEMVNVWEAVEDIANEFAEYFEADNERFSRERFMQAVEGDQDETN